MATKRITALVAIASVALDDLVVIVDDVVGVPTTMKATIDQIQTAIAAFGAKNVSTTGTIRAGNGVASGFLLRNAAGSADLAGLNSDASNRVAMGDTAASNYVRVTPGGGDGGSRCTGEWVYGVGAAQQHIFQVNGSTSFAVGNGYASVGTGTMPATGTLRFPDGFSITCLTGGVDRSILTYAAGSGQVIFGDFTTINSILNRVSAGGFIYNQVNSNNRITVGENGVQLHAGSLSIGGGVGVMGVSNATTNPTSNPTGGGILYADAGAGKWRGSSGTVTTFGPADPHCPTCGRDFATEHKNDDLGEHFAICIPCMVDAVAALGADVAKFSIVNKRNTTKAQWIAAHDAAKAREIAEMERLEAEAAAKAAMIAELEAIGALDAAKEGTP
jgi:hypothetical protein